VRHGEETNCRPLTVVEAIRVSGVRTVRARGGIIDVVLLVPPPSMPCPYLSTRHSADHGDKNANGGEPDYDEKREAEHHAAPIRSSPERRYPAIGPLGFLLAVSKRVIARELLTIGAGFNYARRLRVERSTVRPLFFGKPVPPMVGIGRIGIEDNSPPSASTIAYRGIAPGAITKSVNNGLRCFSRLIDPCSRQFQR
jgi:hypothetical protein